MGHERLIRCIPARSLGWDETQEVSIDRITAIGFASRYNEIGEAMLRVDALDAGALHKVILLVIRRLNHHHKIDRGFARKIAFATLHEYMRPNCIYCGGKGEEHRKGRVVTVCPYCEGSGLHRYNDKDRKALIYGGKDTKTLSGVGFNTKVYEDTLTYVRDAVRAIVVNSDRRLGG